MKNYSMFNYDWLFGDHFKSLSLQARMLYIEMSFYASQGFVSNPKTLLDYNHYDISVLNELIANGDILTLKNRNEVFITSYFVHNHNLRYKTISRTPFYNYWKGKLYFKDNGIATFTKIAIDRSDYYTGEREKKKIVNIQKAREIIPTQTTDTQVTKCGDVDIYKPDSAVSPVDTRSEWDTLLDTLETPKND